MLTDLHLRFIFRRGCHYVIHGISVCGRGVFTTKYGPNKFRSTYAGQHRDGTQTPSNRPMDQTARFAPRRRSRRPRPPRYIADGRATQAKPSRSATHDHAVTRSLAGSTYGRHEKKSTLMHPDNRSRVHTSQGLVEAASLPCHAQHTAVPNAATLGRLHCARLCGHTARCGLPLHSHPVPRACCLVRRSAWVSRCAPLTLPSPRSCFPRASPTLKLCHTSQFCHPVRFGRPRKPWPTCHCAWRCACTAATKRAHSTAGHTFGYLSNTNLRVLYGTHGVH